MKLYYFNLPDTTNDYRAEAGTEAGRSRQDVAACPFSSAKTINFDGLIIEFGSFAAMESGPKLALGKSGGQSPQMLRWRMP